jgi:hypothetical protein
MKSSLLGSVAIAAGLMIQSIPASSQQVYRGAHPAIGHSYAGHGPVRSQYQYRGYAGGQDQGYAAGAGVAALAAGALIGGVIASQNQGYYQVETYPVYSDPSYVYSDPDQVEYNNRDSVEYCEQTYRSYNPASGTYLGYDGVRHPCP